MGTTASPALDHTRLRVPAWRLGAQIAILAGLIAILYYRIVIDLALDWWNQPAWSQGMLIPPLAAYIAWMRRPSIFAQPVQASRRGLLLVGAACLLYLVGRLGAEFFLPRISIVVLLAGLTWTFWGVRRLRELSFPFLLLATMVPLPIVLYNAVAGPLQLFASSAASSLAQLCGITVYQDGNVIHLAQISLGVEEACSGLNSLSALIVASLLLGFLRCSRPRTRFVLFALSMPLAIAVNVIRVAGTAIIADYHQEFALGFYHSFSGWLVFVVGFAALYGLAKALHIVLD